MGNPQNYSTELPRRCLRLIDELWPQAEGIANNIAPFTSTFLLAMSMPIINLPIERLDRAGENEARHYVNDGIVSAETRKAFKDVMNGNLAGAPFYIEDTWRFVERATPPNINLTTGLSAEIAAELWSDQAKENAGQMPLRRWASILRNALAHGGIAYLDVHGQSAHAEPVKMYAFASGRYGQRQSCSECKTQAQGDLVAVNFLRISDEAYRDFLRRWVQWLQDIGAAQTR